MYIIIIKSTRLLFTIRTACDTRFACAKAWHCLIVNMKSLFSDNCYRYFHHFLIVSTFIRWSVLWKGCFAVFKAKVTVKVLNFSECLPGQEPQDSQNGNGGRWNTGNWGWLVHWKQWRWKGRALEHWNYWKRRALELMLIDVEGWSIVQFTEHFLWQRRRCESHTNLHQTKLSTESTLLLNDGQFFWNCTHLMPVTQSCVISKPGHQHVFYVTI